ncbi:hypothetical protein [Populibacterium corticicola]|uniref:hypothetical protein n=1 Tax=Populibacterium corticicola TaxID=1812826 RepID=UPI00366A8B53
MSGILLSLVILMPTVLSARGAIRKLKLPVDAVGFVLGTGTLFCFAFVDAPDHVPGITPAILAVGFSVFWLILANPDAWFAEPARTWSVVEVESVHRGFSFYVYRWGVPLWLLEIGVFWIWYNL